MSVCQLGERRANSELLAECATQWHRVKPWHSLCLLIRNDQPFIREDKVVPFIRSWSTLAVLPTESGCSPANQ